jgi:alpha-1,6-mannosyltransferase
MKTLHVTNAWHANSGGIATFYRALIRAAEQRQHEIRLVVPGEKDGMEEAGRHARIYTVAAPQAPLNPDYRLITPRSYLSRSTRLREIVRHERPDIVEVCDKYTLNYFAGMLRTGMMKELEPRPLVVGLSCERMDDNVRAYLGWNQAVQPLVRFYMKWIYFSLFDHHIANSDYTATELRAAAHGHAIRRGTWIRPMGVHTDNLGPQHRSSISRQWLLQEARAGGDAVLMLYTGRLAPEKNLGLLLDTLQELQERGGRDWRLVVVGDGVQRRQFVAEAERRTPGRLSWLGHIRDRQELARVYANCDLFLHPNPREPFGIAPLEAMASGLPVVVPDQGGVLCYANSSNAWVVPAEGRRFADAAWEISADVERREEKINCALKTAAGFGWEKVAGLFLELYEDLARHRSGDGQLAADFFSTAPTGQVSPVARLTAGVLQRLLATR